MAPENPQIASYSMVKDMYEDGWFPNHLVDKVKQILLDMCDSIEERKPADVAALLSITHAATEKINDLEEEFFEHDSELETVARESIAESFDFIVKVYGFSDLDIEDVIEPREW